MSEQAWINCDDMFGRTFFFLWKGKKIDVEKKILKYKKKLKWENKIKTKL